MNILAIPGSLRESSLNAALLRSFVLHAPGEFKVRVCSLIGELPLFNPDLEADVPAVVLRFYQQVAEAHVLLLSSPEYAHGVTGAIKNALDWLVGFEAFVSKPVAVLNASPRAHHADDALRETLRTMSAVIIEPASLTVPLVGAGIAAEDVAHQAFVKKAVADCLQALSLEVVSRDGESGPSFSIGDE